MDADTGVVVIPHAQVASSLWMQFIGLIGKRSLPDDYALAIPHCDRVHTFGVRFPIDVVYCDRKGRVLRVVASLPPGRLAPRARGAWVAWEAGAGVFAGRSGGAGVRIGQRLVLADASEPGPPKARRNGE
ncbi:MAG: DUF192 domain-containing protein [Cytophagales bacterium]|nr:DUF192 domain-containing protein [Armatimonadota bacterium]